MGESSPPGLLWAMVAGGTDFWTDFCARGAGTGADKLGTGFVKGTGARLSPADGLSERGAGERADAAGLGVIGGGGFEGSAGRAGWSERMKQASCASVASGRFNGRNPEEGAEAGRG